MLALFQSIINKDNSAIQREYETIADLQLILACCHWVKGFEEFKHILFIEVYGKMTNTTIWSSEV